MGSSTDWLKWVHQLIDEETRSWKEDLLRRFFHQFDVEEIMKLKIPGQEREDMTAWYYEKTGMFTVWSAYHLGVKMKELEKGQTSSSANPDGGQASVEEALEAPSPPQSTYNCLEVDPGRPGPQVQ